MSVIVALRKSALLLFLAPLIGLATIPASAQQAAAASSSYLIHPGDQLNVQVFGEQTLSQNTTVLADGTIDYPLVGRVAVAGKTPNTAAEDLKIKLEEYIRDPIVTISVVTPAQPNVLVLGNVKNPGKYQIRTDGTISDAIAAAGGLGPTNGPLPDARVALGNGQIESVSLQQLLREGNLQDNVPLTEGSVVYVPGPATFNVEVVGAVDHPGEVQLNEGDRLSAAIAKAGSSPSSQSDLNHIRLVRQLPGGKTQTYEINLYKALEDAEPQYDVQLQKGDVVYVPQARPGQTTGILSSLLYVLTRLFVP